MTTKQEDKVFTIWFTIVFTLMILSMLDLSVLATRAIAFAMGFGFMPLLILHDKIVSMVRKAHERHHEQDLRKIIASRPSGAGYPTKYGL